MVASAAGRLAIFLIDIYRRLISPMLGSRCRFMPSCSEYSRQAVELHGLKTGGKMALRRMAKCHPFNPGGYDPVTQQNTGRSKERETLAR